MKKIILLLLSFLYISVHFTKAQSCPQNISIYSQFVVDNFALIYPNCGQSVTNLTIYGENITNLNGLAGLTRIEGDLIITNNPLLTSLSGLNKVTYVGGVIDINNNNSLTTLAGFDAISNIRSSLRIVGNPKLISISALNHLRIIRGFLSVGQNALLPSLSGLEGILAIQGALAISGNNVLKNLDELHNLKNIGGYLFIVDNPSLTNLTGLINLNDIDGYIKIDNNNRITSLAGLDNIDPFGIQSLMLENSNVLSFCGVKSICMFLWLNTNAEIYGNATGCASIEEIQKSSSCIRALPVDLISFEGKNTIEGNILSWQTTSETNNAGFSIERSVNGKFFEEIGFVEGSGDANQLKNYSFTDTSPAETTYYRLKQTDFDQTFAYSKIIVVKNENKVAGVQKETVIVFPNPARGYINIETKNRDQNYRLQSLQGIVIKEAKQLPLKPIETSFLKNGVYLLTVGGEVHKVVVNN